jgi:hypothetical protein
VTVAEALGFPGSQAGKIAPDASVVTVFDGEGLTPAFDGLATGVDGDGARLGWVEVGVEATGADMQPDSAIRTGTSVAAAADLGVRRT